MLAWLHSLANLKRASGHRRTSGKTTRVSVAKKPSTKVRPKRPSATRKRKSSEPIKRSYGRYYVQWDPRWQSLGGNKRYGRFSSVLTGKEKGAPFLAMLVEPDDHGQFKAELYPKDDFPGMPNHLRAGMAATVKSVAEGKKWCELMAGID